VDYSSNNGWEFWPPLSLDPNASGTFHDSQGWKALRPYHHVYTPANLPRYSPLPPSDDGYWAHGTDALGLEGDSWYATIVNANQWIRKDLSVYTIKASCAEGIPCPSPLPYGGECAGRGTCYREQSSGFPAGSCACETGWGGVGCNTKLVKLNNTEEVSRSLDPSGWDFYEVQVPPGTTTLLVEMRRSSGDPALFLRGFLSGQEPTAVPNANEFAAFADVDSFRARLNYHYRLQTDVDRESYDSPRFYIAVYNNDVHMKEEAKYVLRASWDASRPGSNDSLCPSQCSSRGRCVLLSAHTKPPFECHCDEGEWQAGR
ncbi:unnamed protein product, partial [Ostreobium quekettii]